MNKQQLANKIWESANKMRSKIEANEYKDYILGFIFYKYLSEAEEKFLLDNDYTEEILPSVTEEDSEIVGFVQDNLGYFISYENLFSTWLRMGKDFDVSNVRDALSAFSRLISPRYKDVFDGVLDTLQTGLSKLGDSSGTQTKSINNLIHLIKDIPMDGKQDYDVLGFIYEYLISMFAANAGKKAGEFYTPHEVSVLMSEIVANHLKDRKEIKIYDPTSGSGSLLINIGRAAAKHMADKNNIKYYAQELKQNTYNLTRMNLIMRDILPDNIVTRNGDTLEEDWPYFDDSDPVGTYDPLYVDAVVSNPPYSQNWDPTDKGTDPRYARFGLAPKSKADYAFLLHDLFHVKPDGIMTIVLPHGVLFRGGEEGEIRRNLIENNHIDTIIGLPANIFFGTGIPTIIMVLRQERPNTDVLIVDASKGFVKVGKNNQLRACDIKKIVDTVNGRIEIPKFSRKVSRDEIRANDYNLNIPRYVDSSEKTESWDLYATMFGGIPEKELMELSEFWDAFPGLKETLFTTTNGKYFSVAVKDLKKEIKEHEKVVDFLNHYADALGDFSVKMNEKLIAGVQDVSISGTEAEICEDIFGRLESIPLVDKYAVYQILDDNWSKIAVDVEIIQTEGMEAVRKVDPNMVVKKKDGKEVEVQDGWIGHVIPFDLVQRIFLREEKEKMDQENSRLSEISGEYESLLEEFSEDEKSDYAACFNDDNTAFVNAEIGKNVKALTKGKKTYAEDSAEGKILKVGKLIEEEKVLKNKIKKDEAELILLSKETIEKLSDEQVDILLYKKWILPLSEALYEFPNSLLSSFMNAVQSLAEKYAVTFEDIEVEIQKTKKELNGMLGQLTGNEFDMKGLSEFQKLLCGE